MKKILSLVLVLVMVLSLAPAAFAEAVEAHTHEYGEFKDFLPASELDNGIARAYCKVKGCTAYIETEIPKLPNIYVAEARDNEKHRSTAVTAALDGKNVTITNWSAQQVAGHLSELTDRHFNQAVEIKALGYGVGYFGKLTEQTVTMPAAQFKTIMESRDGLCLTMTTGTASVALDPENTQKLYEQAKEEVKLQTKLSGDKLSVELQADGKAVELPMTVLTWCAQEGKYIGDAESELMKGYDRYTWDYTLAYTESADGSVELSKSDSKDVSELCLEQTAAKWKLRLGDKFWF